MTIGPVPSESARAWLDVVEEYLRRIGPYVAALPFSVPPSVMQSYHDYFRRWRAAAAEGDTFLWESDEDPAQLRVLVQYGYNLSLAAEDLADKVAIPEQSATGLVFEKVVISSILEALANEGEAFAERLVDTWPVVAGE